jgi:LAO/AO transport system kinase
VPSETVEKLLAGDKRSLSRVLTWVENGSPDGRNAMRDLYSHTGQAHIIGITGPTGSGKSTLTGAIARALRKRDKTVAIVAVDPTSPFTQGAILGDRIRMQDLTSDPGVFIRSMATRGALGGLAASTNEVVSVMDASGKDIVLVETVGAGQDEVEIAETAHTTIVVNIPGAGDDMQAIKAGILEIADILVINKADLPNADSVFKQLHIYTDLQRKPGWNVPILKTVAHKEQGIEELLGAIADHWQFLESSGQLGELARKRARRQLLATAQSILLERVVTAADGTIDELTEQIAARSLDPRSAAEQLIKKSER